MDIQLIYVSEALRTFTDAELDDLLSVSAKNNSLLNVTGMLLYGNQKFMQVLEGEADVIDGLVQKILQDKRHQRISVMVKTPIKQRDFSKWSMGFRRVDRDCLGDHENFYAFFEEEFDRNRCCEHSNLALSVLKSFALPREDFSGN